MSISRRQHAPARDAPAPFARQILAIPPAQTFARDLHRQGHAVVQPILERDERLRRGAILRELGEAREFAQRRQRVLREEEGLQHVDRNLAQSLEAARDRLGEHAQKPGMRRALGMEAPGRREQGERAHRPRPPRGQGQREQAAHAIAHDDGLGPGFLARRVERGLEPLRDVVGKAEAALFVARARPNRPASAASRGSRDSATGFAPPPGRGCRHG